MSTLRHRLNKTFAYPSSDASSDASGDDAALDEEHQEHLIAQLARADAQSSAAYRQAFAGIAMLAALVLAAYAAGLVGSGAATAPRERAIAVPACSSLLCSAYMLLFQPLEAAAGRAGAKSPLEKFLVPLNAGLAALMLVAAALSWRRGAVEAAWRHALPGAVFVLSVAVRRLLAPLDLDELRRARYELKGA